MEFDPFGQHQTFHDSVARRRGVPLRHFSCRVSECGGGCLSGGGLLDARKWDRPLGSLPGRSSLRAEQTLTNLPGTHFVRRSTPSPLPMMSVKKHSFYVSLGHATQQQKLQSSPRFGVFKADFPTGLLIRSSEFCSQTPVRQPILIKSDPHRFGTRGRAPGVNGSSSPGLPLKTVSSQHFNS